MCVSECECECTCAYGCVGMHVFVCAGVNN